MLDFDELSLTPIKENILDEQCHSELVEEQ